MPANRWTPRTWIGLALLGVPFLGAGCSRSVSPAPRPSVILVSIDTLRPDHLGLYGYERDTTPFLDEWSKQAVVFDKAFTTAAWTLVAHMTMLTGLLPEQHDVFGKNRALSPEIPLLAERLKAAGYRTVGLYKEGWIHARHGFDRGFEVFLNHADMVEADAHLQELLPQLAGEEPFFLFVHLFDVHCGPFDGGEKDGVKQPETNRVYPAPEPYEHLFVGSSPPLPEKAANEIWHTWNLLDPEQLETVEAMYDGNIRQVDDQLARWFADFEHRGLLQNTLVIVTSDHGEALGQRGKLDQHGECWQEGLHIPLIVRHPSGLGGGKRVDQPVHLGDLVPTILSCADLPIDPRLPGVYLFDPIPEQRIIYGIKLPEAFALRWPEKYVKLIGPKSTCRVVDLELDPDELAPRPVDVDAFEKLRREVMDAGAPFPKHLRAADLSPSELEEMHKLGYGGEVDEEDR